MPSRVEILRFSRSTLMVALPVLLVLPSACRIVRYKYWISHKDTRTVAKEWIELNIPAKTRILVDDYCIPLKMSPVRAKELLQEAELGPFTAHAADYYRYYYETVEEPTYHLLEISHPWRRMMMKREPFGYPLSTSAIWATP